MTQVIRELSQACDTFSALFDDVANKRLIIEAMFIDELPPSSDEFMRREYRIYIRKMHEFNPLIGSEGNSRPVSERREGEDIFRWRTVAAG